MQLGPADKESIRHSRETIMTIMQTLKNENKINSNYKADFHKLDKFIDYSDICAVSLSHFDAVISLTAFDKMKNDLARYGITEPDIMSIYASLIFNQFLLMYAYLGNVIVSILKGVRIDDVPIRGT